MEEQRRRDLRTPGKYETTENLLKHQLYQKTIGNQSFDLFLGLVRDIFCRCKRQKLQHI